MVSEREHPTPTGPEAALEQALSTARSLVERALYDDALEAYEAILAQHPTSAEAYKGRGRAFVGLGRVGRAEADFDRACAAASWDWECFFFRAQNAIHQGAYERALRDLRRAEKLESRELTIHLEAGRLLQRLGERCDGYERERHWLDAVEAYSRAFELEPRCVEALQARARLFMVNECFVAALADFSLCVLHQPEEPGHWVGRGNAFYELNNFPRAIHDYQRALELEPRIPEVYLNLGCIALDRDHMSEALEHFDCAISMEPEYARAWLNRGLTRYYLGLFSADFETPDKAKRHFDHAERDLLQAVSIEPVDSADARFALARLHAFQRRYRTAIEHLDAALSGCPEYVDELVIDHTFEELRKLREVKLLMARAEEQIEL